MTEFEKRVKLAEAMGLGFEEAAHGWRDSFRIDEAEAYEKELPNPYKDANDCEALITWLHEEHFLQFTITVTFGRGVRFNANIGTHGEIETDDWKQGVCELALQAISKGGSDE